MKFLFNKPPINANKVLGALLELIKNNKVRSTE
ncbi:hypothetical protein J2W48_000822 [Flavobacterium piscis]|uniref:Uncharacterized protein n=1 Tax=Flavobacterium piscis TaxID=1114874 RepID=A0ABU1Y3T6_9FLAO|nr:hypothetical protein [Flavobacterium piscis]